MADEKVLTDAESRRYETFRDYYKTTLQMSGEYAKWIVSSLLLLHSGAIAAFFQKNLLREYVWAVMLFAIGIILALGAGFMAWLQLQWSACTERVIG